MSEYASRPDIALGESVLVADEEQVCLKQLLRRVVNRRVEDLNPDDRRDFLNAVYIADQHIGEYDMTCNVDGCLTEDVHVSRGTDSREPVSIIAEGSQDYCLEESGIHMIDRSQPGDDHAFSAVNPD